MGVIKGAVQVRGQKLIILIGGKSYELRGGTGYLRQQWASLKKEVEEKGSCEQALVVYPQVDYGKYSARQEWKIKFKLVRIEPTDHRRSRGKEVKEGEFTIGGLWQYIPQCSSPCLTIKKNWSPSLVNYVEPLSSQQKAQVLRPTHLPVEWWEAPVEAFRYSKELAELSSKPWFVKVKAVFLPESAKFKVIEQLAAPTLERPKYLSAYP